MKLADLPEQHFHTVVTSPPYWGLRDYKVPPTVWPAVEFCPMPGLPPVSIPAMTCCHGLEPDPLSYVAHEVLIFRAVWRVLRNDGTLWLNLGDCYAANGGHTDSKCNDRRGSYQIGTRPEHEKRVLRAIGGGGLKTKDQVGIPWRVAYALQADGWILRMDVVWNKPNPMPESVTDRPCKSHEYVFLLSKSKHYFYDTEAVKVPSSGTAHPRGPGNVRPPKGQAAYESGDKMQRTKAGLLAYAERQRKLAPVGSGTKLNASFDAAVRGLVVTRHLRSVWTITTQPFKGAHFATYPAKLVEPCILAGTSAHGCCAQCGAPWERVLERVETGWDGSKYGESAVAASGGAISGGTAKSTLGSPNGKLVGHNNTLGWQPTCKCHGRFIRTRVVIPPRISVEQAAQWGGDKNGEYNGQNQKNYQQHKAQPASTVKQRILENATKPRVVHSTLYSSTLPLDQHPVSPCRVLDPFGGSGTTAMVALQNHRHATLIELNSSYVAMAESRAHTPKAKIRQPRHRSSLNQILLPIK